MNIKHPKLKQLGVLNYTRSRLNNPAFCEDEDFLDPIWGALAPWLMR